MLLDYVYGGAAAFELLAAFPQYPTVVYPDPEAEQNTSYVQQLLSPTSQPGASPSPAPPTNHSHSPTEHQNEDRGCLARLPAVAVAAELLSLDAVKYFGLSSPQHLPTLCRHFLGLAVEQHSQGAPTGAPTDTLTDAQLRIKELKHRHERRATESGGKARKIKCTVS